MSTPTIQLAFQGGGAKLAAMLPVVDAFSQAASYGYIEIERVSGTSAGAICAALIASGADVGAARQYIIDKGPVHMGTLVPARLKALMAKVRKGENLGLWDLVKERRMVRQVALSGEPLLSSPELQSFIRGVLNAGTYMPVQAIEDCPTKLIITASDVVNSTGILHEQGDIVTAVVDSCSLPVLLRSFAHLSKNHYVDGGLCDNLPVDCLLADSRTPIFAVFPEVTAEKRDNSNILSYFVSLLSASINHNVQRSIAMVGNPYRFPSPTEIGLLDFETAIKHLKDNNAYKVAFDEAMDRIVSFSKSYGFTLGRSHARVVDSVDIDQFRTTLSGLTDTKDTLATQLHAEKGKFIVRVNDDRRMYKSTLRRTADTITRVSQFKVLSEDLRYYRATVNVSGDSVVPTIWSARNVTRKSDIPIVALPLHLDSVNGTPMRHCLLQFIDHNKHFSIGEVIELHSTYPSSERSDLRNLNMGKPDYFGFSNSTGLTIDEVELILVYPSLLGEMTLMPDTRRCKDLKETLTQLDVRHSDGIPIDRNQTAIGMSIRNVGKEAAVFVTAVPS